MGILITGGAGFIGSHLAAHYLEKGFDITIWDNLFRGVLDKRWTENKRLTFSNVDLTDHRVLSNLKRNEFDIVFHLAAINGTRFFYEIPYEVIKVNLITLFNILELLPELGDPKLVWTSSSEVYAGSFEFAELPIPTPEDVPLSISDVFNPRFTYAGSKIAGELICLSYARTHDVDISIVRAHNIYGPKMGREHVISEFLLRILKRENPFPIYGAENSRAFCYVMDFIRGLEKVARSRETNGKIFNLGNDKEVKIIELAELMFDIFNFHPRVEIFPAPLGSVLRRCPDIDRIRKLVDYEPKIGLREGIKRTYEWYYNEWQMDSVNNTGSI